MELTSREPRLRVSVGATKVCDDGGTQPWDYSPVIEMQRVGVGLDGGARDGDNRAGAVIAQEETREPGHTPAGLSPCRHRNRAAAATNRTLVHEVLEVLQRQNPNLLRRRLGLEGHWLFRERVYALALRRGRLLDDLHLQKTGHGEQATTL